MQAIEVGPEGPLVDRRTHAAPGTGRRLQRAADGNPRRTIRSITARHATARFNVTGLKAAPRYRGELTATPMVAVTIRPRQSNDGQRRRQKSRRHTATNSSARPSRVNTAQVSW